MCSEVKFREGWLEWIKVRWKMKRFIILVFSLLSVTINYPVFSIQNQASKFEPTYLKLQKLEDKSKLKIVWKAPLGSQFHYYHIYVSEDESFADGTKIIYGTYEDNVIIDNLKPNTKYYLRIIAVAKDNVQSKPLNLVYTTSRISEEVKSKEVEAATAEKGVEEKQKIVKLPELGIEPPVAAPPPPTPSFSPTFEIKGSKSMSMRSVSIKGNYGRFLQDQYQRQGFDMDQKTNVEVVGQVTKNVRVRASFDDTKPITAGQEKNVNVSIEHPNFMVKFGEGILSYENAQFTLLNKQLTGISGYIQTEPKGSRGQGAKGKNSYLNPLKLQFLFAKSKGIPSHDEFDVPSDKENVTLTFTLSHRPIIANSERVKVSWQDMQRDKDYTIDYTQGTVTFKKFLEKGTKITVDYEYSPSATGLFERNLTGLRLESNLPSQFSILNSPLFLGMTYLQEADVGGFTETGLTVISAPVKHQVYGIDFNLTSDIFSLSSEYAQSIYNPNRENELMIDNMEDIIPALFLPDGEETGSWILDGIKNHDSHNSTLGISVNTEQVKEGSSSLAITYTLKPAVKEDPAFVHTYRFIYESEFQQIDWTNKYRQLQLWVYGDANNENLSVDIGGNLDDKDEENYYRYTTKVDFAGWKLLSIRIPEDLQEVSHDLEFSLADIRQIRIYLDNKDTLNEIQGKICIDEIKVLEQSPLEQRWSNIETDSISQLQVKGHQLQDNQVLALEYELDKTNENAYVSVAQQFDAYQDFSNYKKLSFQVYGDNNNENLSINLVKDSENYYRYTKKIDFDSWQQITLSLLSDFQKQGSLTLSEIRQICFYITPSTSIQQPTSGIYIDNITLSDVSEIRGDAFRLNTKINLKDWNLGMDYKKANHNFASIGSSFLSQTREIKGFNVSYKHKYFNISTNLNTQTDKNPDTYITHKTTDLNYQLGINLKKLPQLNLAQRIRKEEDQNVNQGLNNITLGLTHKIKYLSLSSNLLQEKFINNLNHDEDKRTEGFGIKISVDKSKPLKGSTSSKAEHKKLAAEVGYSKSKQKKEKEDITVSVTDTLSLGLKIVPSDRINATGDFNKKIIKDGINNTKNTATIANLKLDAIPNDRIATSIVYNVTSTTYTINGISTPTEVQATTYQVKALPTNKLTLFTEYVTKKTLSQEATKNIYNSDKKIIKLTYQPRKTSSASLTHEIDNSKRPEQFQREYKVTHLDLNTTLTKSLTMSTSYEFDENKEKSTSGLTKTFTKTITTNLTQKISKSTSATLFYTHSLRDDKQTDAKTRTYNLSSLFTHSPKEKINLRLNFNFGKNLYGQEQDAVLSFNYNPTKKTSIISSLKFIQAKDYSANLFTTEAKINF